MHTNAYKLMKDFRDTLPDKGSVLDVGSYDVNGTYKPLWQGWDYLGVDIVSGPNVDKVVPESCIWSLGKLFDVVISGQCLEHCSRPWALAYTIGFHLKPGSKLFLCAPFQWEIHRYPKDYWRFCPDGMEELIKIANCKVLECGLNGDDCYGIGQCLQ